MGAYEEQGRHAATDRHQAQDALTSMMSEYIAMGDDEAPLHVSHGLADFVHEYFHNVVAFQLLDSILQAKKRGDVGVDMEGPVRDACENMFLAGIRFSQKGYRLHECQCGELTDEQVEEFLRDSH